MIAGAAAGTGRCPRCNGALGTARQSGLCPRCLLDAALDPADDGEPEGLDEKEGPRGPRRIGGYQVLGEIARGGVGIVYRAWQSELKREVALKTLLAGRRDSHEALERFRREAELMAALDHPGILPVYEVGVHEGVPWFSMKLAEGGNLAERAGTLHGRYRAIAGLLARVARAVDHAHRSGVLHRDLKPSNIVFDRAGQPLVTDFGAARRMQADSSLTGIDALIGTPRYVAPEVLTRPGAQLTAAVDIYGLGAILYELLTGTPPLAELTPLEILRQIATRPPLAPRQLDAQIPAALEAICLRCLEKRPEDRYPSAEAFAAALDDWLGGSRPSWPAPLRAMHLALPSRRRRAGIAAGLLALATLAGAALWHTLRDPLPMPDPARVTRTVAVVPAALEDATPAVQEAARQLAAHLHLAPPLRLLPFERTLAAITPERMRNADNRPNPIPDASLYVGIVALSDNQRFVAVGIDDLREESLFERTFEPATVERIAKEISATFRDRRSVPTTEARLSRHSLALLRQAIGWLRGPSPETSDKAINAFRQVIQAAPQSAIAHAWLAYAYLHHGGESFRVDAAIGEAERARRMDPTLGLAHRMLGMAYQRKHWYQRAIAAHEQSRALGSLWVDPEIARLYDLIGRFDVSYRTWQDYQRFGPPGKQGQASLGHLLLSVGEKDAGEHALQLSIDKEPSGVRAPLRKAELAMYRGDAEACREHAGSIPARTWDGYFSARELIRVCAAGQGDFAAALDTIPDLRAGYARAGDASHGDHPALPESILLAELQRYDALPALLAEARQALQADIDSGSEDPVLWLRMAAVQRLHGEIDAAYATLEHAFSLGLTINRRNRWALEFLPFRDDARFQALAAQSRAEVARQRESIRKMIAAKAAQDDGRAGEVVPPNRS